MSTYRTRVLEKMCFKSNADITSYALRNGLMIECEVKPPAGLGVLLVEDSPRIAERVRELLVQEGLRVLATCMTHRRPYVPCANSGRAAYPRLAAESRHWVQRAGGRRRARPPTIVMTNYALPQYRERARQLGVKHFLNKAMDFERLPDIVAEIRAGISSGPTAARHRQPDKRALRLTGSDCDRPAHRFP